MSRESFNQDDYRVLKLKKVPVYSHETFNYSNVVFGYSNLHDGYTLMGCSNYANKQETIHKIIKYYVNQLYQIQKVW